MMRDEHSLEPGKLPYHEAISHDRTRVVVLQPSNDSADAADLTFHHKTWNLPSQETPALLGTVGTISTTLDRKRWTDAGLKSLSFTSDLAFLRVGSQIFSANSTGEYRAIDGLDIASSHQNTCFEDVTSRDSLLVVASRRKMPAIAGPRGRETVKVYQSSNELIASSGTPASSSNLSKGFSTTECEHRSHEPSTSTRASDTSPAKVEDSSDKDGSGSDSSCPSDETSEWNSAEESWSEGSTEVDELGNSLTSSVESSCNSSEADSVSDDGSENPQDDAASDTVINSYGQLYEESDSDGGDVDFDCGPDKDSYDGDHESDWSVDNNPEEDLHFDSDDEERLVRQMAYSRQDKKRDAKVQQGVLTIYDLAVSPPTQVFTFTHELPIMLYESPPAIHPTKPLVVWPLCGGDVLFADFEGKSYFIRRARTTTRKSRSPVFSSHVES